MQTPSYELIERIANAYGAEATRVHRPQSGYRNQSFALDLADGGRANLIVYKREDHILPRIQLANTLGTYLHELGLPVRHPLDSRITAISGGRGTRYAALYNYLPGHTIAWEGYTRHHIKLMGQAMSHLHDALRQTDAPAPRVADEYGAIFRRMHNYFTDPRVAGAIADKLGLKLDPYQIVRQQRLLHHSRTFPAAQLLHLDLVRSNLLFGTSLDDPKARFKRGGIVLTGIIDFEKAAIGHPLFDIARTLAFLMVDCESKTPKQIRKYFLQSGYNKRGPAQYRPEWDRLIDYFVDLFLLYDFYKFLKHNPYESLSENHHFRRTRDLLLQRHLLISLEVSAIP
jgi:Ser/Thr protein kinase RdoA (MazF antagonist)